MRPRYVFIFGQLVELSTLLVGLLGVLLFAFCVIAALYLYFITPPHTISTFDTKYGKLSQAEIMARANYWPPSHVPRDIAAYTAKLDAKRGVVGNVK